MAQTSSTTEKLGHTFETISCCWHEAGHVLFGLLRYFKITSVSVSYVQVIEGITHYRGLERQDLDPSLLELLAIDEVRMSYAGLVAERLYYRDICGSNKFPASLKEGWNTDFKAATDTIKRHNLAPAGAKRAAFKRHLQSQLHAIMIEHWVDLKLIAHAIYKTKRLSFDDLKALLTKKSVNRKFWKERFREIEMLFAQSETIDSSEIMAILA
jgi:hypothetical protein